MREWLEHILSMGVTRMKIISATLLFVMLLQSMICSAYAADATVEHEIAAASLKAQGILIGDAQGDLRLDENLTRAELAVVLTRLHGGSAVKAHHYTWACYYTDVPEWAKPYVGYCTANLLVCGYGDMRYGSQDPVLPAAACTVILRAFDYDDGEGSIWSYGTASNYALKLGLISQETADKAAMSRGDIAVLIYRAQRKDLLPQQNPPQQQQTIQLEPDVIVDPDGTIIEKTITQSAWSREDFSSYANPAIFSGYYSRAWYNAIRQSIIDKDIILSEQNDDDLNPKYRYAHTTVPDQPTDQFSAFCDLLWRFTGTYYKRGGEHYTQNQYAFPGYCIIKAYRPEVMEAPLAFIQMELESIKSMTKREQVVALNSYLCGLMTYDMMKSSSGPAIFSEHLSPVPGSCGNYAEAFGFLCDAAGIPCITVSSHNHTWNEVYVDGSWLVVDTAYNDVNGNVYLLTSRSPGTDRAPQGTMFAKELLVPGSTT